MNLFELTAKLTLDDTEYKRGIENAQKQASTFGTTMDLSSKKSKTAMDNVGDATAEVGKKVEKLTKSTIVSGIKTVAGWAGVALAVSEVVKKLKEAIYNATEFAGTIKDLAQVYGLTYQQIQEVNYLAQESGKNAEWAIRKAQSSGQEYWEVLGLTNEEYKEMIAYATEMGIILGDDIVDGADRLGDQLSQLKYQWQSLMAGLLAGDENAEENLLKFFNRVMAFIEEFAPVIIQFVLKLAVQLVVALVKMAPELVGVLFTSIIEAIFSIDWIAVGWNIIKGIAEGFINGAIELLGGWLRIFGIEVPKVDFGVGEDISMGVSGQTYEISERSTQELTIRVESNGVTANDKEVASSLETIIDKKIGEMLGGI